MATGEDNNKGKEGKGFAGLSSLVSEIDTTHPPAPKKEPVSTTSSAPSAAIPAWPSAQPTPPPSTPPPYRAPAPPSADSSVGKWLLGIAAVIGWLWVMGESNKKPAPPTPTYAPSAQAPAFTTPSPTVSAPEQAPSRPVETKPPVGQDLVFSVTQIRYCLAEDIRMEGAKSALNNYSDSDVDSFNAMVSDYNSRCGSFRYRRGVLEGARRDIEPYRSQLQSDGKGRFERSPSTGKPSSLASSRPAPDATVLEIQRKLNEFGYDAGTVDGLMGRGTRSAILAFQRDNGLAADGNPTLALLDLLSAGPQSAMHVESQPTQTPAPAIAPITFDPSTRAPTRQESESSSGNSIPQNAQLNYLGNDWECKRGYFKYSNECRAVQIPQNGKLTYFGNDWECNRGYFKYRNECSAVQIPQNGKLTYFGNDWECNRGHVKSGNECRGVQVPQNGKLTYFGNDWECNRGYFKHGNECHALQVPMNGKLTYFGNDWECEKGYRKAGDKCISVYTQ